MLAEGHFLSVVVLATISGFWHLLLSGKARYFQSYVMLIAFSLIGLSSISLALFLHFTVKSKSKRDSIFNTSLGNLLCIVCPVLPLGSSAFHNVIRFLPLCNKDSPSSSFQ